MAASPEVARANGKKGGRPKGALGKATLEKKAVLEAFQMRVMQHADDLFNAQLNLAKGVSYLYRVEEKERGKREHVLVTEEYEIKDVLDEIGEMGSGVCDEHYYYISTKSPDNKAIDSMLDRAVGKVTQSIDHTTLGKELPTPILNAIPSDDSSKED